MMSNLTSLLVEANGAVKLAPGTYRITEAGDVEIFQTIINQTNIENPIREVTRVETQVEVREVRTETRTLVPVVIATPTLNAPTPLNAPSTGGTPPGPPYLAGQLQATIEAARVTEATLARSVVALKAQDSPSELTWDEEQLIIKSEGVLALVRERERRNNIRIDQEILAPQRAEQARLERLEGARQEDFYHRGLDRYGREPCWLPRG